MYQPKDPDDARIAAQAKATATALEWVSRILAIVAVMVLPGLGGSWLDARFGTNFLTFTGFALGLTIGMICLIAVVKAVKPPDSKS